MCMPKLNFAQVVMWALPHHYRRKKKKNHYLFQSRFEKLIIVFHQTAVYGFSQPNRRIHYYYFFTDCNNFSFRHLFIIILVYPTKSKKKIKITKTSETKRGGKKRLTARNVILFHPSLHRCALTAAYFDSFVRMVFF